MLRDGVAYFDLTTIFQDVTDTVYIDDCCHFNQEGRDILAREVTRRIVEALRTQVRLSDETDEPTPSMARMTAAMDPASASFLSARIFGD